ncbi:MAG TPA: type IX secretion system membrane protein PorP/SprF [Bacteroidetes bacterium]|nr:type IX secretion system membrane protein PorP/SprF [Bacteroidota bacterium]
MKRFLKYYLILLGALLLLGSPAAAQQDPHYSQYMFNGLALNPAYAGSREALTAVLLLRKQWVQLDGAPATGSFSLHGPSRNERHGFGVSLVHDRLGVTRQNLLNVSYAYRIPMGTGALALGLRGGLTNFTNRYSLIETINPDQVNPGLDQSANLPRFGTGIYYKTSRFYLGLSAPNILAGRYYRFEDQTAQELASNQKVHYFGTLGVVISLGENLEFKPSVVAKYVENAPAQFDLNAAFLFQKTLWLGAGYRTGDALVFMLEYFTPKGLRFGYSYDMTTTQLNKVNTGSHELMLGFDLGLKKSKIITPRYF